VVKARFTALLNPPFLRQPYAAICRLIMRHKVVANMTSREIRGYQYNGAGNVIERQEIQLPTSYSLKTSRTRAVAHIPYVVLSLSCGINHTSNTCTQDALLKGISW
jgi:hypothetical protein